MVDDHGHQAILNHCLHLLLVACCNIGQEPNSLLLEKDEKVGLQLYLNLIDLLLAVVQKAGEMLQCSLGWKMSCINLFY